MMKHISYHQENCKMRANLCQRKYILVGSDPYNICAIHCMVKPLQQSANIYNKKSIKNIYVVAFHE